MAEKTDIWQKYEDGVDYKTQIGLYDTVDLNERFFAGKQWDGIADDGLPTPVINFLRYASAWKIAAVTDRKLKMKFEMEGQTDAGDIGIYAKQISAYCDVLWERLKMDYLTKEGLKQAAITGDYVQFFYWNPDIKTGQALTGDIATQIIDNVNYYPGDPNNPDVQSQPYIIIAFREHIEKIKAEAKKNGVSDLELITGDEENGHTAGDMGKIELQDNTKATVLLYLKKKDGKVYSEKSTRNVIIQPEKLTNLTMYPVALMNWDTRKNCCHGTAEITGLIPNQVAINKIAALALISQMNLGFPKVVYDQTRIKEWSNDVAAAIAVNGDVQGAATYLNPGTISFDVSRWFETLKDTTMEMMGANTVTLGNVTDPDNTSAFMATRDAAIVPLQAQQSRFYQFVEEIGLIWIDFIKHFYKKGRMIPVKSDAGVTYVPIPEKDLNEAVMKVKIDVGPSSMWSEIQTINTMNSLVQMGLPLEIALKHYPKNHIPEAEQLVGELLELKGMMMPEPPQGNDPQQSLIKMITAASQNGEIETQAAEGLVAMIEDGADDQEIRSVLNNLVAQGMAAPQFQGE